MSGQNCIRADFRPHTVIVTKDEVLNLGPDAVGQPLEQVFGAAVPPSLRRAKRYRHGDRSIIGRPDPDA